MGLHDDLLRDLQKALEEREKIKQIQEVANELDEICNAQDLEKENLIEKTIKEVELDDEEKRRIRELNKRYNSKMKELGDLIMKN